MTISVPVRVTAVAVIIIAILVLSQIPKTTDVTIHLVTGRVSFAVPRGEANLIASFPVEAIDLLGPTAIRIDAERVVENHRTLTPKGGRIFLRSIDTGSPRVHLSAEGLRLMRLGVAEGAHVVLYTDRSGNLFLNIRSRQGSAVEVAGLGSFLFDINDIAVLDASSQPIMLGSQPRHVFSLLPIFRVLVFDEPSDHAFDLVVQPQAESSASIPVAAHVKVTAVDFRRAEEEKLLSEVRSVTIDSIMQEPETDVFVVLKEGDRFTLQSVNVSGDKIECVLTGRTNSIRVGKEPPYRNVIPSMLSALVKSDVVGTVVSVLKWLKGVAF